MLQSPPARAARGGKAGFGVLGWVFEVWEVGDTLVSLDRRALPQRWGGGGSRFLLPDGGSGGRGGGFAPLWE